MKIRVVVTGRSYHSVESLPSEIELQDNATLNDALRILNESLSNNEQLPPSVIVALSGQHVGTLTNHQNPALKHGDELTLIAPVAGG